MTQRGYLTRREQRALLKKQRWRCACREGCGRPVWPGGPVHYDHRPPLALTGVAKPNQAVTPHCHARLTKADRKQINKAKDQAKKHEAHLERLAANSSEIPNSSKPRRKLQSRNDLSGEAYRAKKRWLAEKMKENRNG